jgi:hypothetical protein
MNHKIKEYLHHLYNYDRWMTANLEFDSKHKMFLSPSQDEDYLWGLPSLLPNEYQALFTHR